MSEHIIFLFFIIFLTLSTIGYGYIFSNIFNKSLLKFNIGYQGIIGFFFLSVISIISSFITSHGQVFNSCLHLIGLFGIGFFIKKKIISTDDIKYFFIIFFLIIIAIYIYKNHDDFSYYHLTYSLSLSENKFIIGAGNFNHGFRTYSSLFFFHSILYLPSIQFYLFHLGPFLILLFFNLILISKLFDLSKKNEINFLYFLSLLSFCFVNVVFYRIGEHGTDRSAQIILFLIFITFFEIKFLKSIVKKKILLNLMLLLIVLAASLKAIYVIYLILLPLIFLKDKKIFNFSKIKSLKFYSIVFLSLSLIFIVNFLNTGCLLYPAEKTCTNKVSWHIPHKEVAMMNTHYEWWAKAGGGPNYKSDLKKDEYIKNFIWVENWIERHFFNKILDTLGGIFAICLIISIYFLIKKKHKIKKFKLFDVYLILLIFFAEWFLKHPSMRYGGFVLISLPIFVYLSSYLASYNYKPFNKILITKILISIIILTFNLRNIERLEKEIVFYKYNLIESPYFYVEKNDSKIIYENKDFKIFSPTKSSCWAIKTPCSNRDDLVSKKKYGFNIISRINE